MSPMEDINSQALVTEDPDEFIFTPMTKHNSHANPNFATSDKTIPEEASREDVVKVLLIESPPSEQSQVQVAVMVYQSQEIIVSTKEQDIEVITTEILDYKKRFGESIIEIGKRLNKVKAMLQHGEWSKWLRDKVNFSEVTAQRFMRIAKEYANPSLATDLGFTKAFTLLTLEVDEREKFISGLHEVDGMKKNVYEMSKRELTKAIRDYKTKRQNEQLNLVEESECQIPPVNEEKPHDNTIDDFEGQLNSMRMSIDTLIDNISTLKQNPNDYRILSASLRSLCEKVLLTIPETQ